MMGNVDIDARLKFSLSEIKLISEDTDNESLILTANTAYTGNTSTTSPKTGDDSNMTLWFVLMLTSAGALIVTATASKRKKKTAEQERG